MEVQEKMSQLLHHCESPGTEPRLNLNPRHMLLQEESANIIKCTGPLYVSDEIYFSMDHHGTDATGSRGLLEQEQEDL